MSDVVIKAENISKYYKLGQINNGTLAQDIQSYFARKRGKEDPNSLLGSNSDNKDGFWALSDINFEVHRGDRLGIIGRNGAGKSTLLKILSEITAPTTGTIGIKGRVASLLEVGTGFHPEMTGRENIYLNGAILGMKRAEINAKLNQIIEFSEIEKHIDTPVKRYSSGMFVRLAFAVAAHLDSDILIADEVLAVGDAQFQKKALGKMNELSTGQGRTVLFVSHQMNAVKSLCDKGMILDHGEITCKGDVDMCISQYQVGLYDKNGQFDIAKYNNEFFDLKDFSVIDENGKTIEGTVSNDETVKVKIVFDLKKKHSGFCLGFSVYDNNEIIVFWSYPSDNYSEYREPEIGQNEYICEIPSHFLNEGDYYICLQGGIHFQEWLIDPQDNPPRIKISIQGGLSDSPFWTLRRPGICAPIMKWEINSGV